MPIRQSTTEKITKAKFKSLKRFLHGQCPTEGDGFIARVRGVETAIVDEFAGWFIADNGDTIDPAECTIRKGFV